MNMIKKTGGFTLVELIVVIAILAILAGVAVPAYSGYITKAKEASDYSQLDAIKTAVVFAATEADEGNDGVVTKMTVTEGSTSVAVAGTNLSITSVDVAGYTNAITFESDADSAIWCAEADAANNLKAGWNLK